MKHTIGRRFASWVMGLIILFFAINGYIQSSSNNSLLHTAARDRSHLVQTVSDLTEANKRQSNVVKGLKTAIINQNKILRKAGLKTTNISNVFSNANPTQPTPTPIQSSTSPKPTPVVTHTSKPKPQPSHTPTHKPSTKPSPSPKTPVKKITKTVCQLLGVCILKGSSNGSQKQTLRHSEVPGSSSLAGIGHAIFRVVEDVGTI